MLKCDTIQYLKYIDHQGLKDHFIELMRLEEISCLPKIICHCIFSRFVFYACQSHHDGAYQNPKVEIALSTRLSASFNTECVKGLNNKILKISIKLLFSNLKCVQCNSSNCRKGSHTIRK